MIFLTFAASLFGTGGRRGARLRGRRSRREAAVERLTDVLFHRRAGVAGTIGRLGLLAVVAIVSYLVGAGVGAVIMKAPVAVALIVSALLIGWANGDTDTG